MQKVSRVVCAVLVLLLFPFSASAQRLSLSGIYGVSAGGTGLSSTTINQLLYSSATNVIAGLTTANNGVLITSGTGAPSISSTLPSATQDNITRLGTIATSLLFTTSNNNITMDTADASDTKFLAFSGGGASVDTRGGYLTLYGNEHATNAGQVRLNAGNVSGAVLVFSNPAANDRMTITSSGNIGFGTSSFGTSAAGVLSQGIGTAPSTSPADVVQEWVADWNGAGTAAKYFRTEEGSVHIFGSTVTLAGALTTPGTIKSTAASDIGWTVQNAANQACNTTCTVGACVVGIDAITTAFLACTDVTADSCLCAG